VYTDSFQVYDVVDVSEFHHRRVNHSTVFVSERGHHINGIENFGNQAKRHLRRFNGIPKGSFYWFLKDVNGASTAGTITHCYSSSESGIGWKSIDLSYSSPKN
jgi:transposase